MRASLDKIITCCVSAGGVASPKFTATILHPIGGALPSKFNRLRDDKMDSPMTLFWTMASLNDACSAPLADSEIKGCAIQTDSGH